MWTGCVGDCQLHRISSASPALLKTSPSGRLADYRLGDRGDVISEVDSDERRLTESTLSTRRDCFIPSAKLCNSLSHSLPFIGREFAKQRQRYYCHQPNQRLTHVRCTPTNCCSNCSSKFRRLVTIDRLSEILTDRQ